MTTSWEHPIEHAENENMLRTSVSLCKPLENILRTSTEHLWTPESILRTSGNMWEHLRMCFWMAFQPVLRQISKWCFHAIFLPKFSFSATFMPFMILAFSRSHRIDPATAQKFLSRLLSHGKLPNLKDHTCTAGSAGDFYEVCERDRVSGKDHSIKMRWGGSGW